MIPPGIPIGAQDFVNYGNAGGDSTAIEVAILVSPEYTNIATKNAFWGGARWLS